jgi:hypothetical protein
LVDSKLTTISLHRIASASIVPPDPEYHDYSDDGSVAEKLEDVLHIGAFGVADKTDCGPIARFLGSGSIMLEEVRQAILGVDGCASLDLPLTRSLRRAGTTVKVGVVTLQIVQAEQLDLPLFASLFPELASEVAASRPAAPTPAFPVGPHGHVVRVDMLGWVPVDTPNPVGRKKAASDVVVHVSLVDLDHGRGEDVGELGVCEGAEVTLPEGFHVATTSLRLEVSGASREVPLGAFRPNLSVQAAVELAGQGWVQLAVEVAHRNLPTALEVSRLRVEWPSAEEAPPLVALLSVELEGQAKARAPRLGPRRGPEAEKAGMIVPLTCVRLAADTDPAPGSLGSATDGMVKVLAGGRGEGAGERVAWPNGAAMAWQGDLLRALRAQGSAQGVVVMVRFAVLERDMDMWMDDYPARLRLRVVGYALMEVKGDVRGRARPHETLGLVMVGAEEDEVAPARCKAMVRMRLVESPATPTQQRGPTPEAEIEGVSDWAGVDLSKDARVLEGR